MVFIVRHKSSHENVIPFKVAEQSLMGCKSYHSLGCYLRLEVETGIKLTFGRISIVSTATWMIENRPKIWKLLALLKIQPLHGATPSLESRNISFSLPTLESQYLTQSLDFSIFFKPLQLYPASGLHLPASITNGPPPPCEHFVHSPSLAFQFVSLTPRK